MKSNSDHTKVFRNQIKGSVYDYMYLLWKVELHNERLNEWMFAASHIYLKMPQQYTDTGSNFMK